MIRTQHSNTTAPPAALPSRYQAKEELIQNHWPSFDHGWKGVLISAFSRRSAARRSAARRRNRLWHGMTERESILPQHTTVPPAPLAIV